MYTRCYGFYIQLSISVTVGQDPDGKAKKELSGNVIKWLLFISILEMAWKIHWMIQLQFSNKWSNYAVSRCGCEKISTLLGQLFGQNAQNYRKLLHSSSRNPLEVTVQEGQYLMFRLFYVQYKYPCIWKIYDFTMILWQMPLHLFWN